MAEQATEAIRIRRASHPGGVFEGDQLSSTQPPLYAICFMAESKTSLLVNRPKLQDLLRELSELFSEPDQLQPERDIDHWIPFKDNSKPSMSNLTNMYTFRKQRLRNKGPKYSIQNSFTQALALYLL